MRVRVFSSRDCPNCRRLKRILEREGIEYEEVEADIADLIVNYNVFSTPAIEIGGMVFSFAR